MLTTIQKRQEYEPKSFNINIDIDIRIDSYIDLDIDVNYKIKIYRIYLINDNDSNNEEEKEYFQSVPKHIGSIEITDIPSFLKKAIPNERNKTSHYIYIENIFIQEKYRNRGYLRKIIDLLMQKEEYKGYHIVCLPLPQHVEKFKHLGFTPFYKSQEEYTVIDTDTDTYYIL